MKDEILNAITELGIEISKVENYHDLYEEINYNGTIHEIVDGYIDIYYYDLRKWAVDNWEYVEQANEEGIGSNGIDYHKDIQAGQYLKFEQDAVEIIEEIYNEGDSSLV
jgi:hypothetical protein